MIDLDALEGHMTLGTPAGQDTMVAISEAKFAALVRAVRAAKELDDFWINDEPFNKQRSDVLCVALGAALAPFRK